jgi:DNA-binding IscR family transcriptional regulator
MLSLSQDVEHALAALALLARYHDSTSWEAGQIGQGCDIPPWTLDEILTRLVHQGLVSRLSESPSRYTLGRRAVDISITDIVEAVERPILFRVHVGKFGPQSAVECIESMVLHMLCHLTLSDVLQAELQEIVATTQSPPAMVEALN